MVSPGFIDTPARPGASVRVLPVVSAEGAADMLFTKLPRQRSAHHSWQFAVIGWLVRILPVPAGASILKRV